MSPVLPFGKKNGSLVGEISNNVDSSSLAKYNFDNRRVTIDQLVLFGNRGGRGHVTSAYIGELLAAPDTVFSRNN